MIICKDTAHAYYPVSTKVPDLIRGTGRIRYVRGLLLVKPKALFSSGGAGRQTCSKRG